MSTKTIFSLLLLVFFFLTFTLVGLKIGSFDVDWSSIIEAIFNYNADNTKQYAIIELRLPRLIIAFFAGGGLALSGYLMQAMVNNPLADPYLLGTSSGASLGASLVYTGFISISIFTVSLFSFLGAMAVTFMAITIGYRQGRIEPSRLLLAGLALSALMVSSTSLVTYLSGDDSQLKNILYWTMGGFELARWNQLPILSAAVTILTIYFSFHQKQLNVLLLGEDRAQNLGVNVKSLRWIVLLSVAFLTGIIVAVSGPIGFVGLIVPHFIRSFYGIGGKYNIAFTVLWGGVFLLACDVLSRMLFAPSGIPLGIVTSFIGIPFLVYLLGKNKFTF